MKKELKVGEYWRSRNGRKWRILTIDRPLVIDTIVAMDMDYGDLNNLFDNGCVYLEENNSNDLIEPWKDPEPKLVAWLRNEVSSIQWQVVFEPSSWSPSLEDDQGKSPYQWKRAAWLDEPEEK